VTGDGRRCWRDLDELLDTPDFREALGREFPAGAAELADGMTRRSFVRLLGASIALAGVGGCFERPRERILPYVSEPPESTPGVARHYATSMTLGGYATGLLVESHVGRPTKIEGNPDHPASLGAAGVYEQASILQLYDPERARAISPRCCRTGVSGRLSARAERDSGCCSSRQLRRCRPRCWDGCASAIPRRECTPTAHSARARVTAHR
jgi:MoCo/4Fe-4S cofactor protein with predicted Tat translocation signal